MSNAAPADETWFAETMRAVRDSEERAERRYEALREQASKLARELGGTKAELDVARSLNVALGERVDILTKTIRAAQGSLEGHSRWSDVVESGKLDDRDDEILSCVWESLEAVCP